MNARASVTEADIATRLQHCGIDVVEVPGGALMTPAGAYAGVRYTQVVYLSNGLAVYGEQDCFRAVLPTGHDPLSPYFYSESPELGQCSSIFELPALIRSVEPAIPAARRALLGENRDVTGTIADILAEHEIGVGVVGSERAVPGMLAVSMIGKRFTAWYNDTRFTSFNQMGRMLQSDDTYRPVDYAEFIPLDVDGHHLTVLVNGLRDCAVTGTVSTTLGDEWFAGRFNRSTSSWHRPSSGRAVGGVVSPGERSAVCHGIARGLDRVLTLHLPVFANAEIIKCEREVAEMQVNAARADDRERRTHWLRRERAARQCVAEARETLRLGRVSELRLDQPYRFGPVAVQ